MHFLQAKPPSEVIYSLNSNEKKTCLLSIVYIQISNTYLPEFQNDMLLHVEANPV